MKIQMKTPISYYGGKQNMLNEILPLIPYYQETTQYVEPFFGGGAVFFAKNKHNTEVINDLDNRVVNFYLCLKNKFNELRPLIDGTLHAEVINQETKKIINSAACKNCKKACNDLIDVWCGMTNGGCVQLAYAFWAQCNMSFASCVGAGLAFSNSEASEKKTKNKRENFTIELSKRFEKVQIFNRDALNLMKLKNTECTFFYIDPPYVSSDCGHYAGYTMQDFINLLDFLAQTKAKFLLSSYDEKILAEYQKKYNWHQKKIEMPIAVTKKCNRMKTEVLTYNYDPEIKLF